MVFLSSRKMFWALVCCLSVAMLGLALLFYYPDKVVSDKEKRLPDKSEDPLSGSSDPTVAPIIEQVTADAVKDSKPRRVKTKNTLEETKTAFKEIFNNQEGIKTTRVRILIREANEDGKAWIREELIKRLNTDPNPKTRRACLVCILRFRDVARQVLARALSSDSDRNVRMVAAYALSQEGGEQEVGLLLQAVKEDKGIVGRGRDMARVAVSSLGQIGGEQALLALTEIWNNEEFSRGCREQTLNALGRVGDPAGLNIFEAVIQGKEELIRDNAAYGIGLLARKSQENPQAADKAIKLLRSYINDDNAKVRRNVGDALAWVGKHDDIKLLTPLLDDAYSETLQYIEDGEPKEKVVYPVREKAKEAIDKINARLASRQ